MATVWICMAIDLGPFCTSRQILELSLKHLHLCMYSCILYTFVHVFILFLTDCHICRYLMEKIMVFFVFSLWIINEFEKLVYRSVIVFCFLLALNPWSVKVFLLWRSLKTSNPKSSALLISFSSNWELVTALRTNRELKQQWQQQQRQQEFMAKKH